ncbi:cytochrome o ubiquinol oxidase subunit IV [Psychromonas sp. PT13]|uniref:cytochrome o ubiquinol oxidase subunit IV n=1 Tax=Psychromonas sp. PT13 TaxID=3439547 RepID=UPI003EBD23B2
MNNSQTANVTEQHDASHGSVKGYLIGFALSIALTIIPFYIIMSGDYAKETAVWSIVILAVVQIWVQLKFFLHLNFITEEGRANSFSFLFSLLVIVMVVGLSIWIIYESNAMMMY